MSAPFPHRADSTLALALSIVLVGGAFVGAHIALSAAAVKGGAEAVAAATGLALSCLPVLSALLGTAACSNSLRSSGLEPGPLAACALLDIIAMGSLSLACRMLEGPAVVVSLLALSLPPLLIAAILSLFTDGSRNGS